MINASDACGDDVPFESNIFGGLGFLVLYLERKEGFWLGSSLVEMVVHDGYRRVCKRVYSKKGTMIITNLARKLKTATYV